MIKDKVKKKKSNFSSCLSRGAWLSFFFYLWLIKIQAKDLPRLLKKILWARVLKKICWKPFGLNPQSPSIYKIIEPRLNCYENSILNCETIWSESHEPRYIKKHNTKMNLINLSYNFKISLTSLYLLYDCNTVY